MGIIPKRKSKADACAKWREMALAYREVLKNVYDDLTDVELIKSTKEELEELVADAIDTIDQAREELEI